MNRDLVPIDDNSAFVSDENGNVSLVRSENDEVKLEDILNAENELEHSVSLYHSSKKELNINKQQIIKGETFNIFIYILVAIVYFWGVSESIDTGLVNGIVTYIVLKEINLKYNNSRIERYKKRKKIKKDIAIIEEQMPELERELREIKEKTMYKKSNLEVQKMDKSVNYDYLKSAPKVKVRKLVKDNNKNS